MKKTLTLLILFTLLSHSPCTYAQKVGGNGGTPSDIAEFIGRYGEHLPSWNTVKNDLILGLNQNRHLELDLKGRDPVKFKADFMDALNSVPVDFKDERIQVDGVPRACKNFRVSDGSHKIQCDPLTYANEMKNYSADEQYKMVAHEYLGAKEIEPNTYGLSDYPFSQQISDSLESVVIKKWGVKPDLAHFYDRKLLYDTHQFKVVKGDPAYVLHWALNFIAGTYVNFSYPTTDRLKKSHSGFEVSSLTCTEKEWSEPKYGILHHTGEVECKAVSTYAKNQTITGIVATQLMTALRSSGLVPLDAFNFGVKDLQCVAEDNANNSSAGYVCGAKTLTEIFPN